MSFVDLHCHSTASDGTLSPRDVVRAARDAGLSALALTDHDTVAGVAEATDEARSLGIDFVSGIEISCEYPRPGTMHLLGYGIDLASPTLAALTSTLIRGRDARNARIVALLRRQGVPITLAQVEAVAAGATVGRPHFARVLVALGVVSGVPQAFNLYLGSGGSAFVDKETLSPAQALARVHAAGGVACLAHPTQLRRATLAQLRAESASLAALGLDGVEVIHGDHRESLVAELTEIADELGLLKTGGSDFHGSAKPHVKIGRVRERRRVPRAYFDALRERLARR